MSERVFLRGVENGSPYEMGFRYCSIDRFWFPKEEAWHETRCPECHQVARSNSRNKAKVKNE